MKHELKYIPDEYLQPKSWTTNNVLSSSYFENPMTEPLDSFNLQDIKFNYVSNYDNVWSRDGNTKDIEMDQSSDVDVNKTVTGTKKYNKYKPEDRENFERCLKQYGDSYFNEWFRKMAALESAFVQKPEGNKSYCGWFQINKNYLSYYTNKGNITKTEFLNNPKLQFIAAKNLAKEMLTNIKNDKVIMAWAKKNGYTQWDVLAGCWLGGFGNLRNYVYNGKDFADANGTKLSARINNYKNVQI